ncbi:preprotein translocase subunit TatC [Natronolimnobius sp. AArcel1]|uniref:twin-arginine translocase subunit TatC n=1 Tax=Natronolimnobius sp. AArcel1 TaxID=1679093 RepID=UPI0013ED7F4B|nr:twin-arginine translocase subunit TatC [Natronolimnobius sp. AArcel1]NGM68490.1 preprotein translocase subunit TatC [Natronolimnobius sp. AArcel1]
MSDELAASGDPDPASARTQPHERADERVLPDGGQPESDDDADEDFDADGGADGDETPPVETDGEGVVSPEAETGEPPYPDYPDPDEDDDLGGLETPPDDQEMPLADHIEEMVLRMAFVLLFASAGTAVGLLFASDAIGYIWADIFPAAADEAPPPHIYHPLELWLTRIKLSALLGIMVGLPAFVYQCYKFMKPGLYPHERKYYLAAVPTSVILGALGMLFSYVLVLPLLFEYFTFYAEGSADIAYALGETFDLVITLTGFLAIVFQIPLFMMLAIMMGVTTRRWLADKRLYFWAGFFGLSFMFTMDPTMMAPIFVAITMILLFEGTLLILKWVGKE